MMKQICDHAAHNFLFYPNKELELRVTAQTSRSLLNSHVDRKINSKSTQE